MVIDELKARAGFGGVTLEIEIPDKKWRNDELLRGKVNILGGKVIQKIDRLQLRLIREWSWEYYRTGWDMDLEPGMARGPYSTESISLQSRYELEEDKGEDELYNVDLETDIEVEPEQKITIPFEIDISTIREEKGVNEAWKLKARADIPFARDALAECEIKIAASDKTTKGGR